MLLYMQAGAIRRTRAVQQPGLTCCSSVTEPSHQVTCSNGFITVSIGIVSAGLHSYGVVSFYSAQSGVDCLFF